MSGKVNKLIRATFGDGKAFKFIKKGFLEKTVEERTIFITFLKASRQKIIKQRAQEKIKNEY